MNRKWIAVLAAAVILLIGVFAVILNTEEAAEPSEPTEQTTQAAQETQGTQETIEVVPGAALNDFEEADFEEKTPETTEETKESTTQPTTQNDSTEPSETTVPTTGKDSEDESKPATDSTDYETYNAMSGEQQKAFMETFESVEAFFDWYNAAKEEYDAQHPDVEIGDDAIDFGEIINGNG